MASRGALNLAIFAVLVAGAVWALTLVIAARMYYPSSTWPVDAWNYWRIWHGPMYLEGARLFEKGNIYSPVFGLAMWPLSQLPWPVFAIGWSAAGLAVYAWLLEPLSMRFRIPVLAMLVMAITAGNIEWLLALLLIVGGPAGWALPLLTKVTPGLIGPVWFAARGEWRNLAIALGVTAALALVSFAFMPGQWFAWIGVLSDSARLSPTSGPIIPPLFVRVPLAVALTAWAARSNRAWMLPVAMVVAQPDPTWTTAGLFAAIPRLWPLALQDRPQDVIVSDGEIVEGARLLGGGQSQELGARPRPEVLRHRPRRFDQRRPFVGGDARNERLGQVGDPVERGLLGSGQGRDEVERDDAARHRTRLRRPEV